MNNDNVDESWWILWWMMMNYDNDDDLWWLLGNLTKIHEFICLSILWSKSSQNFPKSLNNIDFKILQETNILLYE